jgi:hypothetical protein
VVLAIVAMNALGTPVATAWIPLPVLLAALVASRGWQRVVPLALLAAATLLGARADRLLEEKREERAPVIYEQWDAMAKIKMYDYEGQARGINIDNVANSPVLPFDGDWTALGRDSTYTRWSIDVGWLVDRFPRCRFLSLGAGGGSDVLQALEKGAAEVHAVEVIPHINRMMTVGDLSGYVARDSMAPDSAAAIVDCPPTPGTCTATRASAWSPRTPARTYAVTAAPSTSSTRSARTPGRRWARARSPWPRTTCSPPRRSATTGTRSRTTGSSRSSTRCTCRGW